MMHHAYQIPMCRIATTDVIVYEIFTEVPYDQV